MTIGQLLKHHDFSKDNLYLYDSNGNKIYYETSDGFWSKYDYDDNNNRIYLESSDGYWYKREYNDNGKVIYFENSNGDIVDKRPKSSCNGKVVEIEGKRYQLNELV